MEHIELKKPVDFTEEDSTIVTEILDNLELSKPGVAINPFTGFSIDLVGKANSIYDFIMGCEYSGDWKTSFLMKTVFQMNWPKEYMALLD